MGKGLQIMKGCVSMGGIHVKKTVAFVQKKTAGAKISWKQRDIGF